MLIVWIFAQRKGEKGNNRVDSRCKSCSGRRKTFLRRNTFFPTYHKSKKPSSHMLELIRLEIKEEIPLKGKPCRVSTAKSDFCFWLKSQSTSLRKHLTNRAWRQWGKLWGNLRSWNFCDEISSRKLINLNSLESCNNNFKYNINALSTTGAWSLH